jgi:hypothetical protein
MERRITLGRFASLIHGCHPAEYDQADVVFLRYVAQVPPQSSHDRFANGAGRPV